MIFSIPIPGEDMASPDCLHGKRMDMLSGLAREGRNKDTGCVQLMASEFGHQPAPRSIPEPPTNKFFEGRANAGGWIDVVTIDIPVLGRFDRFVGVPLFPLGDLFGKFLYLC